MSSAGWLQPAEAAAEADLRLLLFPPAGAGGTVFRDWFGLLPRDVAAQVVTLPGRLDRRSEPAHTDFGVLVDALWAGLEPELDGRPYAFFGHSMGAMIAYALTQAIEREGADPPVLLAASAWAPVGFARPTVEHARQPEPGLIAWLRDTGSLPEEIIADPGALAMVLPALRADLELCADYTDDDTVIDCPVVTYSGRLDPLLAPGAMDSWAPRTAKHLGHREFPGHHFYLIDHTIGVVTDVAGNLRAAARP
ncbi:thioesterase II family protein [Actinokineospora fastidiosa]|uniref:Non-ribosomal peptide synthase n=1 Tax=Actinokineospora fastidiosa TaxID=1816 RepID=A0A918GHK9_9PSEU|nr:alpha/beta fold hydrolase [Actinokineospora fastidiosa]GGS35296.1 non-ribosomal peptide synthase [Actinokineospora fastidiosa]